MVPWYSIPELRTSVETDEYWTMKHFSCGASWLLQVLASAMSPEQVPSVKHVFLVKIWRVQGLISSEGNEYRAMTVYQKCTWVYVHWGTSHFTLAFVPWHDNIIRIYPVFINCLWILFQWLCKSLPNTIGYSTFPLFMKGSSSFHFFYIAYRTVINILTCKTHLGVLDYFFRIYSHFTKKENVY